MRYTARVIPGRGEGRKIGFPTLNLEVPNGFEAEYGIYAGWAWLDNDKAEKMPAAIHYGPVPVFGVKKASLEAHIIDANISEAPTEVSLELVKKLREIGHIPDIEALKKQISEDVSAAREALKRV
jgi:riboflavin kinase/FMN adenylyltransferase